MRTGKLSTHSILAFLLGANLGITVTVQLIALRIFDYYSAFLVVGLVCFLGFKREVFRGAGQAVLGLGFVFLAMEITTRAATDIIKNPDFITLLGVLVHYRIALVLFAAVLTFALQSSTAIIGLAFAFAATAHGHELILPVILGANFGIGLTSLFAGISSWEGRRLAAANLLFKGGTVVLILALFSPIAAWIAASPGTDVQQGANFHTAFNIFATLLGIAFAKPVGKLIERTVKPARSVEVATSPATHLDPSALPTPVFALANATRETLRLADAVKAMFEGAWRALATRDRALAAAVQKQDDRVDELNAGIKTYLSQIPAESLIPADQQLHFGLLNFSSQLESVADVVDKSLCGAVVEHANENVTLSPADQADLEELYRKVLHRFDTAISVLATRDRALAQQFLEDGEKLKEWAIEVQKRHYERLAANNSQGVVASTRFLDTFNILRRISGQLSTIGHTFTLP